MPVKRRVVKRKPQRGKGMAEILKYVRDQKLISRGLGLIPHPGAQAVSTLAGMAGLGRQRGRGIFSDLGGGIGNIAHGFFGQGRPRLHL